jgi:IS5 family transposase
VIKRQFGYLTTRYRGLAKNQAQLFPLFALGNLPRLPFAGYRS